MQRACAGWPVPFIPLDITWGPDGPLAFRAPATSRIVEEARHGCERGSSRPPREAGRSGIGNRLGCWACQFGKVLRMHGGSHPRTPGRVAAMPRPEEYSSRNDREGSSAPGDPGLSALTMRTPSTRGRAASLQFPALRLRGTPCTSCRLRQLELHRVDEGCRMARTRGSRKARARIPMRHATAQQTAI